MKVKHVLLAGLAIIAVIVGLVLMSLDVAESNKAQFRETPGTGVEYIIDSKHNLCYAWVARRRKAGLTRVPCEALK